MTTMDTIVRAAIHPSIGIARVGDSSDAFFIGPDFPTQPRLLKVDTRTLADFSSVRRQGSGSSATTHATV